MTIPQWAPGTEYPPDSLVQRRGSAGSTTATSISNPGFESGVSGWYNDITQYPLGGSAGSGILPPSVAILEDASAAFAGSWYARSKGTLATTPGDVLLFNDAIRPTVSAQVITLTGQVKVSHNGPVSEDDVIQGRVALRMWNSAQDTILRTVYSDPVVKGSTSAWKQASVSVTIREGEAYVQPVLLAKHQSASYEGTVSFDAVAWDYVLSSDAGVGTLIFKAVQSGLGVSGTVEPLWPTTAGLTVVDNTVTWEAVDATRVVWEAEPIMLTGATEPTWPTTDGATVLDGTVVWTAVSRRIQDERCPHSRQVASAASKIYAGDGDVVRFCATANPLDWSSNDDAGYLPTGLSQGGSNDVAVLNIYRGNLVVMNANSFQMWQVDPDPQLNQLMDRMEGVGSTWQGAAQPVGNDLFFLSQRGVRTVGIAAASTNLQANDVGKPIDPLIQQAVAQAEGDAISAYFPGSGQYWLAFSGATVDLTVIDNPLTEDGNPPDGYVGVSYTYRFQAAGGFLPYTWAITAGGVPAGTSFDTTLGEVDGVPTTATAYPITVQVTDDRGQTASGSYTITIRDDWTITGDAPNGAPGSAYSYTGYDATGGADPKTWDIEVGALPPRVTMDSATGDLSGTLDAGTYSFRVRATDANGEVRTLDDTITAAAAFIAGATTQGYVISPDGADWSGSLQTITSFGSNYTALVAGPGALLFHGNSSATPALTTDDGATWTLGSGLAGNMSHGRDTYFNGYWYIPDSFNADLLRSADGITFSVVNASFSSYAMKGRAGTSLLVAMPGASGGDPKYSTDNGVTFTTGGAMPWGTASIANYGLDDDGTTFIMGTGVNDAGLGYIVPRMAKSTSGTGVWSEITGVFPSYGSADYILAILYVPGIDTWCAITNVGRVAYSRNGGVTWTLCATELSGTVQSAAHNGTRIVVALSGGKVAYSDNGGETWTEVTVTAFGGSNINAIGAPLPEDTP